MINTLISTDSSILYLLPQGKPDPNARLEKGKEYERPLVPKAGQKGGTCWKYAMDKLRLPIGKNYSIEFERAREFEKEYSLVAHALAKCFFDRKLFFSHLTFFGCEDVKQETIRKRMEFISSLNFSSYSQELRNSIVLVSNFCSQTEVSDLNDYCNLHEEDINKKTIEICDVFFKKTNLEMHPIKVNTILLNEIIRKNCFAESLDKKFRPTLLKILQHAKEICLRKEINYPTEEDLKILLDEYLSSYTSKQISTLHQDFVIALCAYEFGFRKGSWDPSQSIEILLMDLKTNGPILVNGKLGVSYCQNIENTHQIPGYCFSKTAEFDDHDDIHSVVIVGVSKNDSSIYYIDPADKSHPKQRICTTSYENFKNKAMKAVALPNEDQDPKESSNWYTYTRYQTLNKEFPRYKIPICVNYDVGWKNALGIRVSPNWDTTIPFVWTEKGWKGESPIGKDFKFVMIYQNGDVNSEKREFDRNRHTDEELSAIELATSVKLKF